MATDPKTDKIFDNEQLEQARGIFRQLDKTLRGYKIFDPKHETLATYRRNFFFVLQEHLKRFKELTYGIKTTEAQFEDQTIFTNVDANDNFLFRLYNDGVRSITFNQEFTPQDLDIFLDILRTDFRALENSEENSVTVLWKSDLTGVRYRVVESFLESSEEQNMVEQRIRNAIDLLTQPTLHSGNSSSLELVSRHAANPPQRRLREQDLTALQKSKDLALQITPLPANERELLLRDLTGDEQVVINKSLLIMLRSLTIERNAKDFQNTADLLHRLFHSVLRRSDFAFAMRIASMVLTYARPEQNPSVENARLMQMFYDRLFSEESLTVLQQNLPTSTVSDPKAFGQFIASFPKSRQRSLVRLMAVLHNRPLRRLVSEGLLSIGMDEPRELMPLLKSSDPALLADTLWLVLRLKHEGTTALIQPFLSHPDVGLRRDLMMSLRGRNDPTTLNWLNRGIADGDKTVRLAAITSMALTATPAAVELLQRLLAARDFTARESDERRAILLAVAKLMGKEALPDFANLFMGEGGLILKPTQEDRLAALDALEIIGGSAAKEILDLAMQRAGLPTPLKKRAEVVLQRIRTP